MKIGIIQQKNDCNTAVNRDRIASKIAVLAKQGAELIVLQELHDSLYFCQTEDVSNFDLSDSIPGKASDFYCEVAKRNNVVLVTSLFEKRTAGLHHNTAVVIEKDGTIAGKYRQMHIPDDPA
jgi:N-carbamoylputrescine amidase